MEDYLSADDSALLRDVLKRYRGRSCLEIGFGSGSNLPALCDQFDEVAATDIVRVSHSSDRLGRAEIVYCDRANCFRDSSFDVVVFNPPYLPSESLIDRAVDGGRGGIEVPLLFLEEAIRVVRPWGTILFVLSSEGDLEEFLRRCKLKGLEVTPIKERGVFFERLFAYEARRAAGET